MNDTFLRGRTALVTGSVQGIGLAIAERLAHAGAADVLFLDQDLRDPAAIDALMDRALA